MTHLDLNEHLKSRFFNQNLHRAWLNNDEDVVVFPLWNLSGQLVGYQNYRPTIEYKKSNDPRFARYFTRIKDGKVGVWGLESWYFTNTLFLTEGIFDASRLTWNGYSAVAVLSYDISKTLRNWLSVVRTMRPVVAVCDGDSSGRKLGKFGHESLNMPEGEDVSSLSEQQFTKTFGVRCD